MKPLALFALLLALAATARADTLTATAQAKLARLGYYDGKADGSWSKGTANAVSRFQQSRGLRITGGLNPATLNALGIKTPSGRNAPTRSGRVPIDPARALVDIFVGGPYLGSPPDFQIRTVEKAQKNLKLLGFYDGPANGAPDGTLVASLRAYQKANHLRATGRLDTTTLQALGLLYLVPA